MVAGTAAGQGKTIVTYRTWLDPHSSNPRSIAQTKIIEEFERKNPDIEIAVQLMAWQEMHTSIIRDAAAGTAPCLVRPYFETMPQIVQSGALRPLDEFIGKPSAEEKADFLLDWNSTVFNGKKMSFPLEHRLLVLLYRKDLLAAQSISPPSTWDEFVAAGKKLSTKGVYGSDIPLAPKGSAEGFYQWLFPFVWGYGDDFFDKDGNAVISPALVQAMRFVSDGVRSEKYLAPSAVSDDVEAAMQAFMGGRLAMLVLGTSRIGNVLQSAILKDNLGIARVPSPDGTRVSPTLVSGWQIAMTKDCKTPEAAWKFIQHITSPEMTLLNSKIGGELPTRKSVLEDPWFDTPEGKIVKFSASYLADAGRPQLLLPTFTLFTTTLATAAQRIVSQGVDPETTLREAIDRYNSRVKAERP
jgi:multiple sugar transport system substrate-binding protein